MKECGEMIKNLSVYFILPLLGIKHTIYPILNSYINRNKVLVLMEEEDDVLIENPHFLSSMIIDDNLYYVFKISKDMEKEFNLIVSGKYSKLCDETKDLIVKLSGLKYYQERGKSLVVDTVLAAFLKLPSYKKYVISQLDKYGKSSSDIDVLEDEEEWLRKFDKNEFMNV